MRKYIEEFVKLNCSSDLLSMQLFPNAKEITESFGAFRGVSGFIMAVANIKYDSNNVKLISVGDGHTPRTAALFAMRTAWDCYSVDPLLDNKEYPIKRLHKINERVENINLNFDDDIVIIVSVHGHAKVKDILEHIHGKERYFLSIPCCVPHEIEGREYIGFLDKNIWSEKNLVKVWLKI